MNVAYKTCPVKFEVFGDGVAAEKLHKRVSCALRSLGFNPVVGLRPKRERPLDIDSALEPLALANGHLWIEGLLRTEEIELLLKPVLDMPK